MRCKMHPCFLRRRCIWTPAVTVSGLRPSEEPQPRMYSSERGLGQPYQPRDLAQRRDIGQSRPDLLTSVTEDCPQALPSHAPPTFLLAPEKCEKRKGAIFSEVSLFNTDSFM